jgi:hypothetical protein
MTLVLLIWALNVDRLGATVRYDKSGVVQTVENVDRAA